LSSLPHHKGQSFCVYSLTDLIFGKKIQGVCGLYF